MMIDKSSVRKLLAVTLIVVAAASTSAKAAYDCEDDDVVSSAVGLTLCENDDCSSLGVQGGYKVFKALSDTELGDRIVSLYKAKLAAQVPGTQLQRVSDEVRAMFVSMRRMFKHARSVALDYNPRISRYECEAVIPFDQAARAEMIRHRAFVAMLETTEGNILLQRNPQIFEISVRSVTAELMRTYPTQRSIRFTVQPSSKSGFTVSLIQ